MITLVNTTPFKRYAELKAEIRARETELATLQEQIFPVLTEVERNTFIAPAIGTFKIIYVPKWKYTKELMEKESLVKDKIKLLKKQEEMDGKAEQVSSGGRIVFTQEAI